MPPVMTCRSGGRLLPLLLSIALVGSCSVLEDREDCPCRLRVEVRKRCRLTPDREIRLCLRSGAGTASMETTRTLSELQDYQFEMQVPKGVLRADGFVGLGHGIRSEDCLMIPEGRDADSLFWVSGTAEARGETAVLPLRIRKEFAGITLRFLTEEEGPFPFYPAIRSTTAGFRLTDGTPVPGPFLCYPEETGAGCFQAVVPRQASPEDLYLEIRRKGDPPAGDPLSEIPIGRLIEGSGAFSWEDEDLKDLLFEFDYAHASLTLRVDDWELGQSITCII